MTIGVISDTHGDLYGWQKAVRLLGKAELILHAGDVLGKSLFSSELLTKEINASDIPVLISRGNCDDDSLQDHVNWPVVSPYVAAFWHGKLIIMGHGKDFKAFRDFALKAHCDLAITGHTHVASIVRETVQDDKEKGFKKREVIFLNPGSASIPRGKDPASFAKIDEGGIHILTLEGVLLHHEPWDMEKPAVRPNDD